MTKVQLYSAIGLPCLTVMTALVISLVQISGIREEIRSLVVKLDLCLAVLEERGKR
jgi:hypothetical protein